MVTQPAWSAAIHLFYLKWAHALEAMGHSHEPSTFGAVLGSASSQLALAWAIGVCHRGRDTREALRWFREAAKKGHAASQCDAGACCLAENRFSEAVRWFRRAAVQGHAEARCRLGVCLERGVGTAEDVPGAAKWLKRAANQGHAEAQFRLGRLYLAGKKFPKNPRAATAWMRASANRGYRPSQTMMGLWALRGIGVPRDQGEATRWLRMAAGRGCVLAMYHLEFSCGASVDDSAAAKVAWLRSHAVRGVDAAAHPGVGRYNRAEVELLRALGSGGARPPAREAPRALASQAA